MLVKIGSNDLSPASFLDETGHTIAYCRGSVTYRSKVERRDITDVFLFWNGIILLSQVPDFPGHGTVLFFLNAFGIEESSKFRHQFEKH